MTTAGLALAQGEHSRRAAAELQVILGDIRKLRALDATEQTSLHIAGLKDRIKGGYAGIDILMRLADQEKGRSATRYADITATALRRIEAEQWVELERATEELAYRFSLAIPEIDPPARAIKEAKKLHNTLCAACHDNPIVNIERPAFNLYQQAKTEAGQEFFARMLVGVRGDRVTGIDNPFTDIQLMSLIAYYKRTSGNH